MREVLLSPKPPPSPEIRVARAGFPGAAAAKPGDLRVHLETQQPVPDGKAKAMPEMAEQMLQNNLDGPEPGAGPLERGRRHLPLGALTGAPSLFPDGKIAAELCTGRDSCPKPELLAPPALAMFDRLRLWRRRHLRCQLRYSLRVRSNDFGDLLVSPTASTAPIARASIFYVVASIYPHGARSKTFIRDIAPVIALAPDALIMSDPGLI